VFNTEKKYLNTFLLFLLKYLTGCQVHYIQYRSVMIMYNINVLFPIRKDAIELLKKIETFLLSQKVMKTDEYKQTKSLYHLSKSKI